MPATVQAQFFGASATLPAGVNAETGVTWNKVDTQTGTTPIPIPTSTGTNYSYLKALQLAVTATSTTTISNRTVRISSAFAAGLGMHWKTDTQANWPTTFNQQTTSKATADQTTSNSGPTAPSGYTAITPTAVQYDNTSQSTASTGIGTTLLLGIELAVDSTYAGGPGSASLGNIVLGYDEA
ncbi:MAG TPA: hypothetical protein VGJ60_07565 [Chloroflexota bacterium]|jgi:hypothetical protein